MFRKYKISNFTGRMNAFQVIERLERIDILACQNTESVKKQQLPLKLIYLLSNIYDHNCREVFKALNILQQGIIKRKSILISQRLKRQINLVLIKAL